MARPSYTKLKVASTAHVGKTEQRRHAGARCTRPNPGETLRPVAFRVPHTADVVPAAVEAGETRLQTSSVFPAAVKKRESSLSGVLRVLTREILSTFLNARCYFVPAARVVHIHTA